MQQDSLGNVLSGLPAMISGYIGAFFAFLTSPLPDDYGMWFHLAVVFIPSAVGGLSILANTWLKFYLEAKKERARRAEANLRLVGRDGDNAA